MPKGVRGATAGARFIGRHLMLKGKYGEAVLRGEKVTTIRRGVVKPKYEEIILHWGGRPAAIARITAVRYKKLFELSDEDARKDGFNSREELIREIKSVYRGVRPDEVFTIIEFQVLKRLDELDLGEPYGGLRPQDLARIVLRCCREKLSDEEAKVLLELTRTGSIRATAIKLYGNPSKRQVIRRILKKWYEQLIKMGIIGVK
ncbi:MAG: ASCH domain-containing protein [Desulfurococcaceae archaeon]